MHTKSLLLAVLSPALALITAACDPETETGVDATEAVHLRPSGNNGGVWLNTSYMNIDELDTTKVLYDGVTFQEASVKVGNKMKKLDSIYTVDGELRGKIGATVYSGSAFLNAELKVFNQQYSATVTVYVTAYTAGTNGNPPSYQLKQTYFNGAVVYVCNREDSVGPYESYIMGDISVSDTTADIATRANTIYLGCHKGAVGKAGTWGYFPWDIGVVDFEAVVRAVRADYCGNGTSYTHPGVAITLEDVWGINTFAAQAGTTEAVYGPNGALCIGTPRDPATAPSALVCGGVTVPTCAPDVSLATYPDALMWVKNIVEV